MAETSEEIQARWAHIRANKLAANETPNDWPRAVRNISLDGLALIGIDDKNELYWDGQKLVTERGSVLSSGG